MRLARRDYLTAGLLLVAAVALEVPFRSRLAYHWDSAQFALAIRHYDVAISQPQPPGYFLYVMLGRLANVVVGDPHAGLVWVSVLAGGALASVMYGLGTAMFDRRAGLLAGLFTLTSPLVWFHSCVALMYVVDALLVCLTVWSCWRALDRGGSYRDAVVIGLLVGIVGGVRQQTVPGLIPLLLFVFVNFGRPRLGKMLLGAAVALVVAMIWFVPMTQLSGGLDRYWEAVRRLTRLNSPKTLAGGGLAALVQNVTLVTVYCWNGLLLGAGVLLGSLIYRTFRLPRQSKPIWDREHRLAARLLALWILPMILLGTSLLFTEQPGHVLAYLPGLWLIVAVIVDRMRKQWLVVGVATVVCAANAFAFLAWPRSWDGLLFGVGRGARQIRQHDQQLAQIIAVIRARYRPSETVVCHALAAHYLFGLRLFQLHLPEFDHYQLQRDPTLVTPAGRPLLAARRGRTIFVDRVDLSGKRTVLLVVPPGLTLGIFARYFNLAAAVPVPGSDGRLYALPLGPVSPNGVSGEQPRLERRQLTRSLRRAAAQRLIEPQIFPQRLAQGKCHVILASTPFSASDRPRQFPESSWGDG